MPSSPSPGAHFVAIGKRTELRRLGLEDTCEEDFLMLEEDDLVPTSIMALFRLNATRSDGTDLYECYPLAGIQTWLRTSATLPSSRSVLTKADVERVLGLAPSGPRDLDGDIQRLLQRPDMRRRPVSQQYDAIVEALEPLRRRAERARRNDEAPFVTDRRHRRRRPQSARQSS